MKIYFAGSIRGGREKAEDYKKIIETVSEYGEVLTEHIGLSSLSSFGESGTNDIAIYKRDVAWISESDILIADVTVTSIGVGYEIAYAEARNKRVICLYEKSDEKRLSAMINGNRYVTVIYYDDLEDVCHQLKVVLETI